MKIKVKELKSPQYTWGNEGGYLITGKTREKVDPFPCYAHPVPLVKEIFTEVKQMSWDLDVTLYVAHYESTHRTNGWASEDWIKKGEDWERKGVIFLSGKRIPIHPAMTRYLVPHEYGHCVQYHLEQQWDLGDNALEEPYRKLRGMRRAKYEARQWHKHPREVFANDFRYLMCEMEKEFWPHPVDLPTWDSPVGEFWKAALEGENIL